MATLTKEILNEKLYFFCSERYYEIFNRFSILVFVKYAELSEVIRPSNNLFIDIFNEV